VNELGLMELVEESEESDTEMDYSVNVSDLIKKCEEIPLLQAMKKDIDGKPY
jgi:hypothetical protein